MIKRFEVFGVLLALPMVIAGAAFAEPTTPAIGTLPVAVQEPGGGWKKLTLVPAEGNAYWLVGDDGNRVELLQSQVGKHPLPGHLELVSKNYYGHLSLKESGQFPLSTRAMLQFTGKLEDAPQRDAKEELGVLRARALSKIKSAPAEAIELASLAVAREPENPQAWSARAWVYLQQGNFAQACEDAAKGLALARSQSDASNISGLEAVLRAIESQRLKAEQASPSAVPPQPNSSTCVFQ